MRSWFLPDAPDLLGLLGEQARRTVDGLESFRRWSHGEPEAGGETIDAEHAADDVRRALQRELRRAFSTPLDAEDLYELSERLDVVLNDAKNIVREAEVLGVEPNAHAAEMADQLALGTSHLAVALAALPGDHDGATAAADAAIKSERAVERTYRAAMSELLKIDDLRTVVAWRELYRRYARMGDDLVAVAERVWYAVVKEG